MSGVGRRFLEAGYKDPKPLIEIDNYPIIKHVVSLFPGITDVTFICNEVHLKDTNMKDILTKISPRCKIVEVSNENRRGPVDAVLQAQEYIRDDAEIIISYCDYGTVWNFTKFLEITSAGNYDGVIPCYTGFHPHMLGSDNYAFCKCAGTKLVQIKEKEPFTDNKMQEYASNGTYYFKRGSLVKKYFNEAIKQNLNLKGEFYISLVYNLLVRDNLHVEVFEIEKMLQWGTPYDLEIYRKWSDFFNKRYYQSPTIAQSDDVTLILPMAGRGSRFSECGYKQPKPLIDVDGEPMIVRAVDCLPQTNKKVFICAKEHLVQRDLETILQQKYTDCKILSVDRTTEGQACTCEIGLAEVNPEQPILISACDNGVRFDSNKYMKLMNSNVDVIVWSFRNNQTSKINPNMYSWLDVDKDNNIKRVSSKKFIFDDPLKTHAIIGTFFFRKAKYFLQGLYANYKSNIRTCNEFFVDDVINQNISQGLVVKVFEVDDYICWGTPDDYKTYNYWKEYFIKN
jgi:NDP-sugar pyrophosphorylase family protein